MFPKLIICLLLGIITQTFLYVNQQKNQFEILQKIIKEKSINAKIPEI